MSFKDFLTEAPLPDHWDKSKFSGKMNFKEMIAYAIEQSEKVGSGSSRVAFKVEYKGRPTVIKIAKNKKGISQNQEEIAILDDGFLGSLDCVIPLIDYDTDDEPRWIHTEFAEKIKPSFFVKETGVSLADMVDYYTAVAQGNKPDKEIDNKINHDSDLTIAFSDLLSGAEDLESGDLRRIANWGLYKGNAVVIDLGFTETSAKLYKF